jgi:hypothetical protein
MSREDERSTRIDRDRVSVAMVSRVERDDVNVTLLVEREVFPIKCSIVALRLVDHRDMRCDPMVDQLSTVAPVARHAL